MVLKLFYWNIRGMVTPIRLLLEYTGTPYEEKLYEVGPAPTFSRDSWLNEKFTLGLDFPNLPFMIDGDLKVSQSNAIINYIGRRHNLVGKSEHQKTIVDMLVGEAGDMRSGLSRLHYSSPDEYAATKDKFIAETLNPRLERISKFLGTQSFFLGDDITIVDFYFYDLLDVVRIFSSASLIPFDNLNLFLDRFEQLPAIKSYIHSDRYIHYPLNNKQATFGGADTAHTDNPKKRKLES